MKFILLDGNSFCYRAFYAIRELRTSKGFPTNAVYGFVTMLEKLLKELRPDGAAVTFDLKGPTFRHKRYEEYKIQRQPMPDDLILQMPVIKKAVEALNIPIFEVQGYEADDVIATLAKKLEAAGHEVMIVTGDKDALQLVNRKIKVLNPQKENLVYDEKAVKERFGVEPARVVEVMALMGDASDNIPGVEGIGEKTAVKLIGEFGTLEAVLKNVSKIKGDRVKENLVKYKDQALLSRELAVVDQNVPLEFKLDALKCREPDYDKLGNLFKELEFRTLLKSLPGGAGKNSDDESLRYTLIQGQDSFRELKDKLAQKKEWAFDFETTGTNPLLADPIGISFSFEEKEAFYVSFAKKGPMIPPPVSFADGEPILTGSQETCGGMSAEKCLRSLKELFEDPKIKKIGQNLKYEILILRNFGIHLQGVSFDTMVASYCLNPAKPNHNLDDITLEHLSLRITPITELIGQGRKEITMDQVDLDRVYRYGCQDSDVTWRLSRVLGAKLEKEELMDLFRKIEMPLVDVLADMECEGIAIDTKLLSELSEETEKALRSLTKKIHREAGEEFNINSPKQLGEILFEKLRLPVVKRTKTGASTDVEVLQELSELHSLPKDLLKFRELSKLKSTYVDALPLLVNPRTKRVHTSFNQTVTATGRLSSSEPNLQNIPVRTEEGRKIRRAFIAGSGDTRLLSADYSQIELRVLAHLSGDKNLVQAFQEGADIHRHTASLIFNVRMEEVTGTMRDSAKTVNFGVLYGMGSFSLSKSLNISTEAAKDFIKAYFDRYPRVKQYQEETLEKARKTGYVETHFGRRRYIPEISSRDQRLKSFAERTAINAPLQGTASDLIKIAMRRIWEKLAADGCKAKMILQVHDELLFESPGNELRELTAMAREEMSGAASFKVPLEVSVKIGPNWLDMEEA